MSRSLLSSSVLLIAAVPAVVFALGTVHLLISDAARFLNLNLFVAPVGP